MQPWRPLHFNQNTILLFAPFFVVYRSCKNKTIGYNYPFKVSNAFVTCLGQSFLFIQGHSATTITNLGWGEAVNKKKYFVFFVLYRGDLHFCRHSIEVDLLPKLLMRRGQWSCLVSQGFTVLFLGKICLLWYSISYLDCERFSYKLQTKNKCTFLHRTNFWITSINVCSSLERLVRIRLQLVSSQLQVWITESAVVWHRSATIQPKLRLTTGWSRTSSTAKYRWFVLFPYIYENELRCCRLWCCPNRTSI